MLAKEVRVDHKVKGPECINSVSTGQGSYLKYLICTASAAEPKWDKEVEEVADIIHKQLISLEIKHTGQRPCQKSNASRGFMHIIVFLHCKKLSKVNALNLVKFIYTFLKDYNEPDIWLLRLF